jgi:very-short-patch-repair endonuclease
MQCPDTHARKGAGCPSCGGSVKLTQEKFIKRAKAKFPQYDYSKVEYINGQTKIKIICSEHGEWEQIPANFLRYKGCPKCANGEMSLKQFVKKASKVHNGKYDYSLIKEYKNIRTKVKIICPTHGEFEQIPGNHLQGAGCLICSGNYKYTTEEFIKKANIIHSNKYNYSLTKYEGAQNKIKIICPEHGVFEQAAYMHLYGASCIKCAGKYSYTTKEFTEKAKIVHGNKYDYSLVNYKNQKSKVEIICPIHGSFKQQANAHLNGQGCPGCNDSKGEVEIKILLKNNEIMYLPQYTFVDCKNIRPLKFDFYLPEHNTCIEYDGRQHFEPIDFFGGNDGLKYIQINDAIKNKYCEDNGIKLIRIRYDENAYEILKEIL